MLVRFSAIVQKSPNKGGWTYVVWPQSANFFGTRARVKVSATIQGSEPFRTSFMPIGYGDHKLPLTAKLLKQVGKGKGDQVDICILERILS